MRRLLLIALVSALAAGCSPQRAQSAAEAKKNADAGAAFLQQNATAPGVMTLPSGVQYKVVRSGSASGATPRPRDEVKVNYEGKLLSGEVFDSTYKTGQPAIFTLGGLIPAWVEALQRMRPGDEWQLFVPAKLGYGDRAAGPIPPGSVLVFRIELLGVLPAGGGRGYG